MSERDSEATRLARMLTAGAVAAWLVSASPLGPVAAQQPAAAPAEAAPAPDRAGPPTADTQGAPSSIWVGTWLAHSPHHGSYQATEYRFRADGSVRLSASVDTVAGDPGGRSHQLIRSFVFGRRVCRFGARWSPAPRPDRVRVDGVCSDGRARPIEFGLRRDPAGASFPHASFAELTVGGRRGYRVAHNFEVEMFRCGTDPEVACAHIAERLRQGRGRVYTEADFDADGRLIPPTRP